MSFTPAKDDLSNVTPGTFAAPGDIPTAPADIGALAATDIASGTITPYDGNLDLSGGIGGTVDNTAVNDAIEDNSAATRGALGLYKNPISKVAFMGDSITNGIISTTAATGYGPWASYLLGGGFEIVTNSSGTAFATSTYALNQIEDTWLADVLASDADTVCLLGGTNADGTNSDTTSEKYTQWLSIITQLQAAGKRPVAFCMWPDDGTSYTSDYRNEVFKFNDLIRSYCKSNGIIIVDPVEYFTDYTDGTTHNNYLSDAIHPNAVGHQTLGRMLAEKLLPYTIRNRSIPDYNSPNWLTGNPYLIGDSSGKATGWNISASGAGSITPTKVAMSDSPNGQWQQIVFDGPNKRTDGFNMSCNATGYAEGDVVKSIIEVEFDADNWEVYEMVLRIQVTDASGIRLAYGPFGNGSSAVGALPVSLPRPVAMTGRTVVFETRPLTVGASPTNVSILINMKGSGTVRVRRAGVVKITSP